MNLFSKSKNPEYSPNEVFPAIDRGRIARDLDLAATGTRNGRDDIPESDRTDLDATENAVVSKIKEIRREGLSRFGEHVRVYRERIGRIDGIDDDIQAAANKAETDFLTEVSARRERLRVVRKNYNEVYDERRKFQEKNRIGRTPHGYKDVLQFFIITAFIILFESVINMVFFAGGHEMGLFGGLVTAFGVSIVNIGVASSLGWFFRYKNHINLVGKICGWCVLLIGIIFALSFNLLVGHFRDATIETPWQQALGVAYERLLASDRFRMESVDAGLLVLMGILIAAFAFWKAYAATDPYPGYGGVGKKFDEKQQEWLEERDDTLKAIKDTRDEATRELNRHRENGQSDIDNARAAYEALIALQTSRDEFLQDCEASANNLLTVYRDANRQARETQPPVYFSDTFRFPPAEELEPPSQPDGEAMKRFRQTVDDAIGRIHEECRKAISSFEKGDAKVDQAL